MSLALVHDRPTATRRCVDVCEVVAELRRQNPRAGADRIGILLAERIDEDRHLLISPSRFIAEKVLTTTAIREKLRRAAPTPRERVKRRANEKAAATAIAAKVKATLLLDMPVTLLGGEEKALRFCLGREVAELGAAYTRIAAKVPADVMCGECLVESEVKALLCA
jgi:hypothetical protein